MSGSAWSAKRSLVAAACLAVVAALAVGFFIRPVRSQQRSSDDIAALRSRAIQQGGLRAAARVTGSIFLTESESRGNPVSLYQLVQFSKVIAVATTETNRSFLTRGGQSVEMHYTFQLEEVIKGEPGLGGGSKVTVVVPGGRVGFEDGSFAQVNISNFRRPAPGRRYLLFLRPAIESAVSPEGLRKSAYPVFEPAFLFLGIYDITDPQAVVTPSGGRNQEFARELRKESFTAPAFMEAIRRALNE